MLLSPGRLPSPVGTDVVAQNLVRNYSPHLAPNPSTAPPTVELRKVLKAAAVDMLKVFLRKWRIKRRREEEEMRRVKMNPVIVDGDFQVRAPKELEPHSLAGPYTLSTF